MHLQLKNKRGGGGNAQKLKNAVYKLDSCTNENNARTRLENSKCGEEIVFCRPFYCL